MENKEHKKRTCLFLCNESGGIIGINESMGKWLGIIPSEIQNKSEVRIETLIPNLVKTDELAEKIKSTNGCKLKIDYSNIIRSEERRVGKE